MYACFLILTVFYHDIVLLTGLTLYQTASSSFGLGSGPIFFANIRCRGSEQSLSECPKTTVVGSYCTHSRDVGVQCERK